MSTTEIETRSSTELAEGVIAHPNGLEITRELDFNEWKEIVERIDATTDRALWSLGDAWAYGQEHFGKDYHDALEQLAEGSRMRQLSGRVATAFPLDRRRQLSFDMHELVSSLPADEQEQWLDDAERQGWTRKQMQFEFASKIERVPVPAFSVRAIGELRELCVQAAARPSTTVTIELPGQVDPKEWAAIVLERSARAQVQALEAVA